LYSKSKRLVIASAAIVAFLVYFSTVQCGLSSPITTPLVVKMDNSSGVNIAADTLKENIPSTLIVDYSSPAYYLAIWRAYAGVIWVGHGSQEGVQTQQGLLAWDALAARVEATPSKDMVLACYSAAILSYTPVGNVPVSFKGEIDAKLGALIIAYDLTGSKATLVKAFQQFADILSEKVQPAPLLAPGEYYVWNYLTNFEFVAFFAGLMFLFFLTIIPTLAGAASGWTKAQCLCVPAVLNAIASIGFTLSMIASGKAPLTDLAYVVLGALIALAWAFIGSLDWLTAIIAIGILSAKVVTGIIVFDIIAWIIGGAIIFIQLVNDYNDLN